MSATAVPTLVRLGANDGLEMLSPSHALTWQRVTLDVPLRHSMLALLRDDPEATVEVTPSVWRDQEDHVRRAPK